MVLCRRSEECWSPNINLFNLTPCPRIQGKAKDFTTALKNGPEPALFIAGQAFNTFLLIDPGNFFLFPNGRTSPETETALGTELTIHLKIEQCHTALGRTFFVEDMGVEFVLKIAQRGEDRVGAGLPQTAERGFPDHF